MICKVGLVVHKLIDFLFDRFAFLTCMISCCLVTVLRVMFSLFSPEPSVRSELMEQVPHIAVYCQENKVLFNDAMPTYILPMVVRYLNDANNQVGFLRFFTPFF